MTAADLKTRTVKDLASMAKTKKVPGWHAMKKDQLVKALLRRARTEAGRRASSNHNHHDEPRAHGPLEQIKAKLAEAKDLTFRAVDRRQRADQRPAGGHGSRSLLAARLLGTQPQEHRAGEGRFGPVLARRPARVAGVRGPPRRHDHRHPAADPRRGNPRRREQLVHRRSQSARRAINWTSAISPRAAGSSAWRGATS